MHFRHSPEIWKGYPNLVPGLLVAHGIAHGIVHERSVAARIAEYEAKARSRLGAASEGDWPEVQAWRRTFSSMGLKPTQYRCASESLLRRFRKDGSLPRLHPLVDLCNAVSLAFGIPIAVFDVSHIARHLEVRHATGDEPYRTFAGEIEHAEPGEVIFADGDARAHARRWAHRQSAQSAVRQETSSVLIVAEAFHSTAPNDVATLIDTLAYELKSSWAEPALQTILTQASPSIEF